MLNYQFVLLVSAGELMTIGTDGHIRVWDFETVDTADVTDESSVFEMDPMNELHVGNNVSLKTLVKSVDSEEPTIWYAQVRSRINSNLRRLNEKYVSRSLLFARYLQTAKLSTSLHLDSVLKCFQPNFYSRLRL